MNSGREHQCWQILNLKFVPEKNRATRKTKLQNHKLSATKLGYKVCYSDSEYVWMVETTEQLGLVWSWPWREARQDLNFPNQPQIPTGNHGGLAGNVHPKLRAVSSDTQFLGEGKTTAEPGLVMSGFHHVTNWQTRCAFHGRTLHQGESAGSRTRVEQDGAVRVKERRGSEKRVSAEKIDGWESRGSQLLESLYRDNKSRGFTPLNGKISTTILTCPPVFGNIYFT